MGKLLKMSCIFGEGIGAQKVCHRYLLGSDVGGVEACQCCPLVEHLPYQNRNRNSYRFVFCFKISRWSCRAPNFTPMWRPIPSLVPDARTARVFWARSRINSHRDVSRHPGVHEMFMQAEPSFTVCVWCHMAFAMVPVVLDILFSTLPSAAGF